MGTNDLYARCTPELQARIRASERRKTLQDVIELMRNKRASTHAELEQEIRALMED